MENGSPPAAAPSLTEAYVSIATHEGKRVILPLVAAQHSALLDNLIRSLLMTHMLRASRQLEHPAGATGSKGVCGARNENEEAQAQFPGENEIEEEEGSEAAKYVNLALPAKELFPAIPLGKQASVGTSGPAGSGRHTHVDPSPAQATASAAPPPTPYALEVPLPVLQFATLGRVACFLVQKSIVQLYNSSGCGYAPEPTWAAMHDAARGGGGATSAAVSAAAAAANASSSLSNNNRSGNETTESDSGEPRRGGLFGGKEGGATHNGNSNRYASNNVHCSSSSGMNGASPAGASFEQRDATVQVFADLDPSRPQDRLIATQVLLESDFLNC